MVPITVPFPPNRLVPPSTAAAITDNSSPAPSSRRARRCCSSAAPSRRPPNRERSPRGRRSLGTGVSLTARSCPSRRPRSPPRLTHAGLALVSVPMGIMSYAYRGSAEDFTAHPLPGGRATAISYRASAVLVAALAPQRCGGWQTHGMPALPRQVVLRASAPRAVSTGSAEGAGYREHGTDAVKHPEGCASTLARRVMCGAYNLSSRR